MTDKLPAPRHSLPGAQVLSLVDLVAHWDVEPAALLAGSGLHVTQLEDPELRVPLLTYDALITRARALTGEPGLGIYIGLRRRPTMYGFLGFAAMSASSLGEILRNAERFTVLANTALRLGLHIEGDQAALRIEELVDPGANRDVATFALMVSLSQCLKAITGSDLELEAHVTIAEPAYYTRFAHLIPRFRFSQPMLQLVFHTDCLALEPVGADRVGMRLALEHCERKLNELALRGGIIERVRGLCATEHGMRSLKEVAAQLEVSPRTLKRKLAAEGVRYTDLLETERLQRADALLRNSGLSLAEISARVGYSTLPSFARAFRRWTGRSPGDHRLASSERASAAVDSEPVP